MTLTPQQGSRDNDSPADRYTSLGLAALVDGKGSEDSLDRTRTDTRKLMSRI